MKPPCLLHIGCPKTGTTAIQRFMALNRAALLRAGILYPVSLALPNRENHSGLTAYSLDDAAESDVKQRWQLTDSTSIRNFRGALRAALSAEMARHAEGTRLVVCSNEHLAGTLTSPDDFARLKELLHAEFSSVRVVVYLRRQDRQRVSAYSTYLRGGGTSRDILGKGRPYEDAEDGFLDYYSLLQAWSGALGRGALSIHIYEDCKDRLIENFLETLGLPVPQGLPMPPVANSTLSALGQEMMRRLNESPLFDEQARRAVVGVLNRRHAGGPRLPTRAEAMAFLSRFAEGNARVWREFLSERQHPLFDADFSEYPAEEAAQSLTFDAALELIHDLAAELPKTRDPALLVRKYCPDPGAT